MHSLQVQRQYVLYQHLFKIYQSVSSVQSLRRVQLFATTWIAARQASLSITNARSSPKLMCLELVMPSSHLILCRPLLLLPPAPFSIGVFSNESTLHKRWPKYCSFSFIISPSNEHPGLVSILTMKYWQGETFVLLRLQQCCGRNYATDIFYFLLFSKQILCCGDCIYYFYKHSVFKTSLIQRYNGSNEHTVHKQVPLGFFALPSMFFCGDDCEPLNVLSPC